MNRETIDPLRHILDEIQLSRQLNSEQHKLILQNAEESAQLAENIQAIISKWSNFWSVIMMLRNITFTVGFVVAMSYFIVKLAEMV